MALRVLRDVEARARVDGRTVTVRFATPGQNAIVRFTGRAADRVALIASSVRLGAAGTGSANVEVYDPNGEEVGDGETLDAAGGDLGDPLELPASGQYAIILRPGSEGTRAPSLSQ